MSAVPPAPASAHLRGGRLSFLPTAPSVLCPTPTQSEASCHLRPTLSLTVLLGSTVTLGSPCAWRGCGSWRRSVCPGCLTAMSLTYPSSRASPHTLLPDLPLLTPQCHLSGCMMDLFVQMAIIMGLKQTLSNCVEYLCP